MDRSKINKKIAIVLTILETTLIIALFLSIYLSKPIYTSKVVFLPQGSITTIITYLQERNFNLNKIDKFFLAIIGKPQSGWIDIGSNKLSTFDFLYKLTTAKAAMNEITLIPGETTVVFLHLLAKQLDLNFEKLYNEYLQNAPIEEGFLIPETYKIPKGISEKHIIYYLINLSKSKHEEISQKIFGDFNKNRWNEYLIIASIIQKEAANSAEMPLVSSVIYNRLKNNMKLQMDGTLNYGIYSHDAITADRIKSDTSKFNTYLYEGLPEFPICTVGIDSIKAAIFPAKTDYLYFVLDKKTKKHIFSKAYNEHVNNINKQK